MLFCMRRCFALVHFALDAGYETALVMVLTWLYNDLEGSDEH
jgi:hypothetical protein